MARLKYLIWFFVVTVLLFVGAKAVFMLCNATGHNIAVADFFGVVAHGLTLDLSTALYFLILPLLVCVASLWVSVPRWLISVYHGVVALAFALAFVADTSLYAFWGFKLDASCLQYLEQPEGITQSVSAGYLLLRLFIVAATAVAIGWLYNHLPYFRTWARATRWAPKVRGTLLFVMAVPLMVIGIRGGLGESTTNIGQVYYSTNQFLNHSAVNPVFSFLYSASHQLGDLSQYDFMANDECQALTRGVYTTESLHADTLLTTTRPQHIVLILLESAGEEFAAVMPRLQALKREGVRFTRCYGNSWRTDRGTVSTLSGYPTFPTVSVMKMPEKSRTLPSLARTLQAEGYQTSYLYGGDINFTNMRSYLLSTGWQQLTSQEDYSAEERNSARWGVRDDITFSTLLKQITGTRSGEQPRLWGFSTLSSHEPWDVPVKKNNDEVLNAFAYLDDCIGHFIDSLKATPQWQSMLIVMTADHGINYGAVDQSAPKLKNHIPMLWVGGVVKEPRTIDVLCNQSDLCATLLGQMGLPHHDFAFSRDVLSSSYTHPTAVHNYNNAQWMTDSTGQVLYDFDAHRVLLSEGATTDSLLQLSKAVLQLTSHDLLAR